MKVRLTAEAERDLEDLGDWIARDDPARALGFVGELRSACLGLADFPARFPLVPRYEAHGVRHHVHGDYLIFYRVEAQQVVVIHILHGARDYSAVLIPGLLSGDDD